MEQKKELKFGGMDPETLKQIFNPFFTTKKAGEGTGLGLALAEQFILSHKGYICAESTPGKGSVFRICLPTLKADAAIRMPDGAEGKALWIVVTDDNRKVLNLLKKNFSKPEFSIITCDAKESLSGVLEQSNPDVLVLEENMDGGSGVDFCMSIQGQYPEMFKIIMADAPSVEILDAKLKKVIDAYLIILKADEICLEYCANRSCEAAYFLMRLCASCYTERSIFLTASINRCQIRKSCR